MASQFKNDIFDFGFVPILVEYLDSKNSTVCLQSAAILTYLCKESAKNIEIIAKSGAIKYFLKRLHSTIPELPSFSLTFLHSVISECPHLHKYYDNPEFVKNVEKLINSNPSNDIMTNAPALLVSMCKKENAPLRDDTVKQLLKTFFKFVQHKNDKIVQDSALGLRMLALLPEKPYPKIFDDEKVIRDLTQMLKHRQEKIQTTALLIISRTINGKNVQLLIKNDIFTQMPKFINKSDAKLVNLALQIIRKILLESKTQTSNFLDSNLFPMIIQKFSSPLNIQKEAAYLLSFFAINGNENHISIMIDKGIIEAYCNFLKKTESLEISESITIGYYSILLIAENRRCEIFDKLESCDGLVKIEKLGKHKNQNIKKLSTEILGFYHDKNDGQTCNKADTW
uniref:Uncharacterized protein n=1 Tax=Panagrolaimus davidi TaxID=227884 RepID=A0A914QHP8_9BILA